MKRRALWSAAAVLGGCSLLPQPAYVQKRDWPLLVSRKRTLPPRRRGRVLLVRSVQPGPGLDQRGLQWLQRDGSVHVDFYERWAVPPAEAVEDGLRRWLAAAGLFSAVVAPGSRMNADFVLEGELETFIADLTAGVARVALAVVLLDQRSSSIKLRLQRTETGEARLANTDPRAIVEALQAALADVLGQTEGDVAAAIR